MQISSFVSDSYIINLCLGYQLCLICPLILLYFLTLLHRNPGIFSPYVWTLPSKSYLPLCLIQEYSYLCGLGGDVTIYNKLTVIYNELNTHIIYKILGILDYIYSPLFSRAFYGGAAVSLWAEYHPEVRTLEQEVQGIQGEETVGQTSLHEEHYYKLPTADTSPSLWSSLTLPRKVGGNERPQCHPGNERP